MLIVSSLRPPGRTKNIAKYVKAKHGALMRSLLKALLFEKDCNTECPASAATILEIHGRCRAMKKSDGLIGVSLKASMSDGYKIR